MDDLDRSSLNSQGTGLLQHPGQGFETLRTADAHIHPQQRPAEHQGMGHIVAITDVGQRLSGQITMGLAHREEVGQGLAGVLEIGEGIDHRHGGPVGVIHQLLLGEGAHGQHIAVATEHPCGVFQGLATTQLRHLGIEVHRLPTQAGHRHLEADAGAGGGLGENQPQDPVAEVDATVTALQLSGQIEQS